MDITACPQTGCGLPAEILERVALNSTDGPVEHARVRCLDGHGFFMPTMMLGEQARTGPSSVPETRSFGEGTGAALRRR